MLLLLFRLARRVFRPAPASRTLALTADDRTVALTADDRTVTL